MDRALRIYWDTSCFICLLNDQEHDRRLICEDVLNHARGGEVEILTSCFTIAEVIRPKGQPNPLAAEHVDKIRRMFRWPWIVTVEVDPRLAHIAAELAQQHGIKPPDAVHAASAILHRAKTLYAWDRDYSSVISRIEVRQPQYMSLQTELPGMERGFVEKEGGVEKSKVISMLGMCLTHLATTCSFGLSLCLRFCRTMAS